MKLISRTVLQILWTYDNNGTIEREWDIIKRNAKIWAKDSLSQYEVKQHNPRFEADC